MSVDQGMVASDKHLKVDIPLIYLSMSVDQGMIASEKHLKVDIPLIYLSMSVDQGSNHSLIYKHAQ
jgi:hypothetical protein